MISIFKQVLIRVLTTNFLKTYSSAHTVGLFAIALKPDPLSYSLHSTTLQHGEGVGLESSERFFLSHRTVCAKVFFLKRFLPLFLLMTVEFLQTDEKEGKRGELP